MVMIGPNFAKSFLNHNLAIFFLIQTTHFQTVPHNRNKFNPLVGFYNHVFVCDTYHYQLYIANIIRKRKNKKCVSSNGKWLLCYFVMSIFSKKDKETKISSSERVKKEKKKRKAMHSTNSNFFTHFLIILWMKTHNIQFANTFFFISFFLFKFRISQQY